MSSERVRTRLAAAVLSGVPGLDAADRRCRACVDLLDVDGAAISLIAGRDDAGHVRFQQPAEPTTR